MFHVAAPQTREIMRNSKRIRPYSSSRSSKVIDLGVNGKPIGDFLLVINSNFSRIWYRFEILTLKGRKRLILPTPPLFEASYLPNLCEYLPKPYIARNYVHRATFPLLQYGSICIRLAVVASRTREIT